MILLFLLYALFGLSFTLGKVTLLYAKPFFIIGTRMLIGGFGIMAYLYGTKSIHCRPQLKDWVLYTKVGLFGVFIPYCLRAWALQYMASTKAAFIFTFMPFSTALLAYFFHREILSRQKMLGLAIGLIGMLPTLLTTSSTEEIQGSFSFLSIPELAVIGSVLSFSYNLINLQVLVKHHNCPAPLATGMSTLIGGFLAYNSALLFERPLAISNHMLFWPLLIAQILISNLICANLQASLLKSYSPTLLAFASFLTPLCAAFFGWVFLGEKAQPSYILSFITVLTGLIVFYYDELKRHKELPREEAFTPEEF